MKKKEKTTQLPGIDPDQVIPSDPQMVREDGKVVSSKSIPELSDEEIEKGLCGKYYDPNNDVHYNLVEGAKWYREQIKQRRQ